METIIGLLIVVLPVVFKLIGKRLEQAGNMQPPVVSDGTESIQDLEEQLKEYLEMPKLKEPMFVKPMVEDSVEAPTPKETGLQKAPVRKSPILVEEEKKPREKIDVKKMIVYSEIMKPKYQD